MHVEHESTRERFKNRFKKDTDRQKQNREERSTGGKIKQRCRNRVCVYARSGES